MDKEQIEYYKERFDDWSRRLEVGTYLANGMSRLIVG